MPVQNVTDYVIATIRGILEQNGENIDKYTFTVNRDNNVVMKKNNREVLIDTSQIKPNKLSDSIPYLRLQINNLYDKLHRPPRHNNDYKTMVIVHGAWHSGPLLETTAEIIRRQKWNVYTPTVKGNKPGDDRAATTLVDAIDSIIAYIYQYNLTNVVLVGHSYGGMVISGVVDRIRQNTIRRLVYWNAFVPLNNESLNDIVPPDYAALFQNLANNNQNRVSMPYPLWREAFINCGDATLATRSHRLLNPHPYLTFSHKLQFQTISSIGSLQIGKSYINGLSDIALPQTSDYGWNLRFAQRLGTFRYIAHPLDHEVCFTSPSVLAKSMIDAGRD
jgi:pimeloyl-ACP methyl ester carboxylesterase